MWPFPLEQFVMKEIRERSRTHRRRTQIICGRRMYFWSKGHTNRTKTKKAQARLTPSLPCLPLAFPLVPCRVSQQSCTENPINSLQQHPNPFSSTDWIGGNQWQKRRRTVHKQTEAPTLANELWQELHNTEDQSDASISTLITTMLRQHNAVDKQPKQSFYNQAKW